MFNLLIPSNHGSTDGNNPSDDTQLTILEILVKIISFLPLPDRKNARLVCWNWYKAASHNSILKNEELVCVSNYSRKQIFGLLCSSAHCHPNLKFQGFLVDRTSVQFWKKCGQQIHSLDFVNCKFSKNAARSVISRCSSLKNLSLRGCSGFLSCGVFDYLTQKAVTRSSLESIRIENDADINDYLFKQVFQIYPQIKCISVALINDRFYNVAYKEAYFEQTAKSVAPVYESKKIFSHSAVYERLRLSSHIVRDLEYSEIDKDVSRMCTNFFDAVYHNPDLKLRSIVFNPSSYNIPSLSALNTFFERQDKLEYVVLKKNQFSNQCCDLILNNCVNLRHLELVDFDSNVSQDGGTPTPVIVCQNILEKLITSKLTSLKLHFDFRLEELEDIPIVENNVTLRSMSINSNCILRKNILLLMEAFQGLTCLNLNNCNLDDSLMQIILKSQVNLECLIVSFNSGITDFGLTGKPLKLEHYMTPKETFSISRLTRLKILNLKDCSRITVKSLEEMTLPELKYLSLQNCKQISFNGFQVIGDNCPCLEFLDLSHTTISPESLIKLYNQLNRLHFLDITFCAIDELSMKVLLSFSESLRYLRHTSNMYYFDFFKKQWKSTEARIWIEAESDMVRKCYRFDTDPSFASGMFKCW